MISERITDDIRYMTVNQISLVQRKKKSCSLIKACVPIRSDTVLTVKPVLSSKIPKIGCQDRLSLNAGQKYCRMLPLVAFCNTLDLH